MGRLGTFCIALLLAGCGGGGGGEGGGGNVPAPPPVVAVPGAFADPVTYSSLATGALASAEERFAVTSASIALGSKRLDYTATTGHLTATDARTGVASASIFYVAYTAGGADTGKRPVTFLFNGGPGSSTMWLHLGAFGPRRVVTHVPSTDMPDTVQVVDNQETLLEYTDLVFIDPVGLGYSQALAPHTNLDFWGVDSDAAVMRDFVRRYISVNKREASPKFLLGESYGGTRAGVMANLLEAAGVKLAGVVLHSPAIDYNSNCGVFNVGVISCEGYIPTFAAVGAYYGRSSIAPVDVAGYVQGAREFGATQYRPAIASYLATHTPPSSGVVAQLVSYTGLPTLTWTQQFDLGPVNFRAQFEAGRVIGRYDARVSATPGSPLASGDDPSLTLVNPSFEAAIGRYLSNDLHYTARSSYATFANVIERWNFNHDGKRLPDTIPDLAAALMLNPSLKILTMGGYYDLATPFYQSELDLARLGTKQNVQVKNYHSGHMIYLDDSARRAQKADLLPWLGSESVAK